MYLSHEIISFSQRKLQSTCLSSLSKVTENVNLFIFMHCFKYTEEHNHFIRWTHGYSCSYLDSALCFGGLKLLRTFLFLFFVLPELPAWKAFQLFTLLCRDSCNKLNNLELVQKLKEILANRKFTNFTYRENMCRRGSESPVCSLPLQLMKATALAESSSLYYFSSSSVHSSDVYK